MIDGQILTNAHVAIGQDVTVEAWDGSTQKARVVKKRFTTDLALLAADRLEAPPASLASVEPKPGAAVIAVGNPLGFVGAVSTGFVRAVGVLRGLGWRRWVQSDVRLAPGNSGGPLADALGQIVGLNTMIASGGLALAIPAATIQRFLSAKSQRALGATVRPVTSLAPAKRLAPPSSFLKSHQAARLNARLCYRATFFSTLPGSLCITPDDLSAALYEGEIVSFSFHVPATPKFAA